MVIWLNVIDNGYLTERKLVDSNGKFYSNIPDEGGSTGRIYTEEMKESWRYLFNNEGVKRRANREDFFGLLTKRKPSIEFNITRYPNIWRKYV